MSHRVTAPDLDPQFVVVNVQLTGVTLGAGANGSVEEVEIPGARVAAKKLHPQLINLGSPQQVLAMPDIVIGSRSLCLVLSDDRLLQSRISG